MVWRVNVRFMVGVSMICSFVCLLLSIRCRVVVVWVGFGFWC